MGHLKGGVPKGEDVLDWCLELGVPQISMWVLSTENLDRPKKEVEAILDAVYRGLEIMERKQSVLDKYEVNVKFVGDLSRLPPKMLKIIGKMMQKTAKYQKKVLNIMIAYGSHFELTETFKKIAEKILKTGMITITPKDIEKNLFVPTPVDLIIRTGGMNRMSGFMMWQAAYAEIYFTKTLWPDFTKKELIKAIKWFSKAQRNYGK
jgi:undecaprenyl diphosphate synthase